MNDTMSLHWHNRETFADLARKHHQEMLNNYSDEIRASIDGTVAYGGPDRRPVPARRPGVPEICFEEKDAEYVVIRTSEEEPEKKTAVLNFASYQHPGSKFLEGGSAQEESLCQCSTLYECLEGMPEYYKWNRQNKNHSLYMDRALYTPGVIFEWPGSTGKADVISCAAPNRTAYEKYYGSSSADKKNREALYSRICFIRDIAEMNKVDILILGAFGCGNAGQDQEETADLFKSIFARTSIGKIIYAVPGSNLKNEAAFRKVFGKAE